jgi:hypothetical protein
MPGATQREVRERLLQPARLLFLSGWLLASVVLGGATATALEVGDKAPDFLLPSTLGEKISLSQFQGKKHVLMEFYVLDFAPT